MKLILSSFLFLLLVSCANSRNAQQNSWSKYYWESQQLGNSHLYLYLSEDSLHYKIDWFIWLESDAKLAFGHFEFEGEIDKSNNSGKIYLPTKNMKTNIKINTGYDGVFPLDEDPKFIYDPSSNILNVFDETIESKGNIPEDKVKELVESQNSWSGELVKFP
jgi:hypothetical protein